jgi:hypothetical protein
MNHGAAPKEEVGFRNAHILAKQNRPYRPFPAKFIPKSFIFLP